MERCWTSNGISSCLSTLPHEHSLGSRLLKRRALHSCRRGFACNPQSPFSKSNHGEASSSHAVKQSQFILNAFVCTINYPSTSPHLLYPFSQPFPFPPARLTTPDPSSQLLSPSSDALVLAVVSLRSSSLNIVIVIQLHQYIRFRYRRHHKRRHHNHHHHHKRSTLYIYSSPFNYILQLTRSPPGSRGVR